MVNGCELIILGGHATPKYTGISRDQNSPQGVIYLLKQELDSNNVYAALRIMASDEQRPLLAVEKLDMQEELARIGRTVSGRNITAMKIDTLSEARQRIKTEFGYLKHYTFTTVKIEELWFISGITE